MKIINLCKNRGGFLSAIRINAGTKVSSIIFKAQKTFAGSSPGGMWRDYTDTAFAGNLI